MNRTNSKLRKTFIVIGLLFSLGHTACHPLRNKAEPSPSMDSVVKNPEGKLEVLDKTKKVICTIPEADSASIKEEILIALKTNSQKNFILIYDSRCNLLINKEYIEFKITDPFLVIRTPTSSFDRYIKLNLKGTFLGENQHAVDSYFIQEHILAELSTVDGKKRISLTSSTGSMTFVADNINTIAVLPASEKINEGLLAMDISYPEAVFDKESTENRKIVIYSTLHPRKVFSDMTSGNLRVEDKAFHYDSPITSRERDRTYPR